MAAYPPDSQVVVHPFAHQRDKDAVIIGDVDRQVFLAIPEEGLDILNSLAEGNTVGETVRRYEEKYHESPDIDDFLSTLASEGFVSLPDGKPPAGAQPEQPEQPERAQPASRRTTTIRWRSHLEWLSPETCRKIFSRPVVLLLCLGFVGGLTLIAIDPGVMPPPKVLVFKQNFSVFIWLTVGVMLAGIMIHEFAHVIAARAAGIPARIGIGNRLYIMVIETDMSGIWLAPKRGRYLAFLSGPLIDAFLGSMIVAILFATRRGLIEMSPMTTQLVQAFLWTFLSRLLWQCFFFLRTDFYYVFASATNCKDLKADTENLLRNLRAKVLRIGRRIDQSGIPRREMWAIRGYSGLFLLGNVITIAALVFVTIPVLVGYGEEIVFLVTGRPTAFSSIDFISLFVLTGMLDGFGIFLWIRALYRGRMAKRQRAAGGGPPIVDAEPVPDPEPAPSVAATR